MLRDTAAPEDVGLSGADLQRMGEIVSADVETGIIPGAVVAIASDGRLAHLAAYGFQDRETRIPMRTDSIFRIASMTKPVVSVAAMMLVEEGLIELAAPVARYLPEFADLRVGVARPGAADGEASGLEAPRREMTVQDLMRHTSGLTYGAFGDTAIHRAYRAANLMDGAQTNAEMIAKLARIPLLHHPGTTFEYGMSTDVLGRIVEAASGVDLDRFVRQRIAAPLGMASTGFLLPEGGRSRLAEPMVDPATGRRPDLIFNADAPPRWHSGGGGLLSTAPDYLRFAQMLLDHGGFDGERLLSRKTVALMTSNHLPPGVGYGAYMPTLGITAPTPEMGQGFGLGFAVRLESGRNPAPGSAGEFYWPGISGCNFWVDPQERLATVVMLQAPAQRIRYRSLMRGLVYRALV